MGMTFGFNGATGNAITRLKAWGIYNVVFKDVEYVSGTSKEGKPWCGMKVKFAGDEGIFDKLFFIPMEDGNKRPSGETGGKAWELPSPLEQLKFVFAHLGEKLSKNNWEKMKGLTFNLPEDAEKMVMTFKKVLLPAVNKSTQIKLIGNNKGYADIPSFVSISKDGEAFISNNWIGENLAFTDRELKQMEKQKNAKPSSVDSTADVAEDTTDNSDLDFEV